MIEVKRENGADDKTFTRSSFVIVKREIYNCLPLWHMVMYTNSLWHRTAAASKSTAYPAICVVVFLFCICSGCTCCHLHPHMSTIGPIVFSFRNHISNVLRGSDPTKSIPKMHCEYFWEWESRHKSASIRKEKCPEIMLIKLKLPKIVFPYRWPAYG